MPTVLRPLVVLAAITMSVLVLTGCTAGQSKAAACTSLIKKMDTATTGLNDALSQINLTLSGTGSESDAAVKELTTTTATFTTSVKGIQNPEVKAAGEKAASSLAALAKQVGIAVTDPASADSTALKTDSTNVSADFNSIRKLCE